MWQLINYAGGLSNSRDTINNMIGALNSEYYMDSAESILSQMYDKIYDSYKTSGLKVDKEEFLSQLRMSKDDTYLVSARQHLENENSKINSEIDDINEKLKEIYEENKDGE